MMLTVTEETREYLHALLAEVAGHVPEETCLRLELEDADEATILFSREMPSDHSIVFDGRVVLVWDDDVESDSVERSLVLYDDLDGAEQALFLVWPKADGRPAAARVEPSEDIQEALDELP
jgi:hypothetical protein